MKDMFSTNWKNMMSKFQYMVRIYRHSKLTTYITVLQDLENYSCHLFQLFVFMNQEQDKIKSNYSYVMYLKTMI